MRTPQVGGADLKVQTGLLGQCKAVGDAVIIGLHAQQACHQRTVRAVAPACGGKAAIEQDLGLGRLLAQQTARCAANAHRARRMAAGRSGHDRAQHIK